MTKLLVKKDLNNKKIYSIEEDRQKKIKKIADNIISLAEEKYNGNQLEASYDVLATIATQNKKRKTDKYKNGYINHMVSISARDEKDEVILKENKNCTTSDYYFETILQLLDDCAEKDNTTIISSARELLNTLQLAMIRDNQDYLLN